MVFSGLEFIFLFLPAFLAVYHLVPVKFKNAVLSLGSFIFYLFGCFDNPAGAALLPVSVIVSYFAALAMERWEKRKKLILVSCIVFFTALLLIFKYAELITLLINAVSRLISPEGTVTFSVPELALPLAISFYTFRSISYLADVCRGDCPALRSFTDLSAYMLMFPTLISGPIARYSDVSDRLSSPEKISLSDLSDGLKTFIIGLALKVLIADRLAGLWNDITFMGYESISTGLAWLGIFGYSLRIYFDFFGYSLMAQGVGAMMGFSLPDNFDHPYLSLSMTEFWRRWHMTLGGWFRRYVYIPMGGNRRGKLRTVLNLLTVWLLTGLWHGSTLNFLIWGLLLFVIIALEKLIPVKNQKLRPLGHLYMALLIPLSWMVFAITDINDICVYFTRLFPFITGAPAVIFPGDALHALKEYSVYLFAGLFFSAKYPYELMKKYRKSPVFAVVLLLAFWAAVYCIYMGMNDPFLYFRF